MEAKEQVCEIRGTVAGRNGEGLDGARVIAWRQHIRERTKLAETLTREQGAYYLRFDIPDNAPQPLLLLVEAQSEHLAAPLLSPVTPAQAHLEIDLAFEPPDRSEWTTLARAIEPLLEGLALSDLVENTTHRDISFLAQQLGKTAEAIMRVAMSARLETAFKIPAPVFYAFLSRRVPAALPSSLLEASENFSLIARWCRRLRR